MSALMITTSRTDGHVHIDVAIPSPKPPALSPVPDSALQNADVNANRNAFVVQTSTPSLHTTTTEPDLQPASAHPRTPSTLTPLPTPLSPLPSSPLPSQTSNTGAVIKSYGAFNSDRTISPTSSTPIPDKALPLVPVDDSPSNTLDAVRARVAQGVALRAINRAQTIDNIKVGLALTLTAASSVRDAETTLGYVVHAVRRSLKLQEKYLFAVAPAGPHAYYRSSAGDANANANGMQRSSSYSGTGSRRSLTTKSKGSGQTQKSLKESPRWPLVLIGSSPDLVEKAGTLACAKFLGRLREIRAEGGDRWLGYIEDTYLSTEGVDDGSWEADEAMLWDIVRKTSHVLNPKTPPAGARSSAQLLASARSRLERLTPTQALSELHSLTSLLPVILIDIRPQPLRQLHGEVPNSLIVARTELEFSLDPRNVTGRLSVADRYDLRVIVLDQDGRASSLAAVALHEIGLLNATDVIGGFDAWKKAGLPTFVQPETGVSSSSCESV